MQGIILDPDTPIRDIINYTRGWNDGHGLVVSPHMGKLLRDMGIKDGYTVTKKVNLTDLKGVLSK